MPESARAPEPVHLEPNTGNPLGCADHPAISVELYGSLRMRAGQPMVPMRAGTIRTAMELLLKARPELKRLLPSLDKLPETHRFSINGLTVTTDLDTRLSDGDRVVLFSASVGG